MPEDVAVDTKNNVIIINSRGVVKAEDLSKSLQKVLKIVGERRIANVIVDATELESLPSITFLYDFACDLVSKTPNLKHAIVVSKKSPNNLRFIGAVAQNFGSSIDIFGDGG